MCIHVRLNHFALYLFRFCACVMLICMVNWRDNIIMIMYSAKLFLIFLNIIFVIIYLFNYTYLHLLNYKLVLTNLLLLTFCTYLRTYLIIYFLTSPTFLLTYFLIRTCLLTLVKCWNCLLLLPIWRFLHVHFSGGGGSFNAFCGWFHFDRYLNRFTHASNLSLIKFVKRYSVYASSLSKEFL